MRLFLASTAFVVAAGLAAAGPASAQSTQIPAWARVSFFAQTASTTPTEGTSSSYSELVMNIGAESAHSDGEGFEYGINLRYAAYPGVDGRDPRTSIYDGYIGQRLMNGHLLTRVGQMWLNDLGSLGSIGGGLVEYRHVGDGKGTRWRAGGFYGVEPKVLDPGYMSEIKKYGAYLAIESPTMRRHVVGYVNVRNMNLTERSVLTFTNYVPVKKRLYLYQAAEVDLTGPAGQGSGGLTYFFLNARVAASDAVEIQGLFHRGRSLDVRTITDDVRNGRPINPRSLDGMLFESYGGRLTVRVLKNLRAFAGYSQDKNNRDDDPTNRMTFGVFSSNVLGTGIDVNVTDNRMTRGTASSWNSWYVSAGRNFGSRVYISGDYSTSLSVLRFVRWDGIFVETRPNTKRISASGLINLGRRMSLQFTAEHTKDDSYKEFRFLSGLSYRF